MMNYKTFYEKYRICETHADIEKLIKTLDETELLHLTKSFLETLKHIGLDMRAETVLMYCCFELKFVHDNETYYTIFDEVKKYQKAELKKRYPNH
jgi:hypothetical protein